MQLIECNGILFLIEYSTWCASNRVLTLILARCEGSDIGKVLK